MRLPALVLTASGVIALAAPQSVHAECTFNAIPPATDGARAAREIIVGRVIENIDDYIYDFRIRIIHVLRGPAHVGEVRRFKAVYPGWPMSQYPIPDTDRHYPPCSPIPGRTGNVIAFSLDALAPDGKTRYNGASWISGRPFGWDVPRTTLAEMQRLAALPPTDTEVPTAAQRRPGMAPIALLTIGVVTFMSLIVSLPHRRREGEGTRAGLSSQGPQLVRARGMAARAALMAGGSGFR
jgi:hypothetical protein